MTEVNLVAEEDSLEDPSHAFEETQQASHRETDVMDGAPAACNSFDNHQGHDDKDDKALTLARGRLLSSLDEFSGAAPLLTVPEDTAYMEAPGGSSGARTSTVPPSVYPSTVVAQQGERGWLPSTNATAVGSSQLAHGGVEPIIFTISDRRVRIDPEKEESSLYCLCRRWIYNDPDARDDKPQQLPVIAASVAFVEG
mmetsp:Transcript_4428/g.7533  ORF Transcript_4428/g.7533 Transcript_4428/m.7533 type:complete len:197 (+) Transcript_4428:239-829(+)